MKGTVLEKKRFFKKRIDENSAYLKHCKWKSVCVYFWNCGTQKLLRLCKAVPMY